MPKIKRNIIVEECEKMCNRITKSWKKVGKHVQRGINEIEKIKKHS